MPTYAYRCADCGPFERVQPMSEATGQRACPDCGGVAERVFSPPAVRRVAPGIARALGEQERSRDEPRVVTREPRRTPAPTPRDPRHARLPPP